MVHQALSPQTSHQYSLLFEFYCDLSILEIIVQVWSPFLHDVNSLILQPMIMLHGRNYFIYSCYHLMYSQSRNPDRSNVIMTWKEYFCSINLMILLDKESLDCSFGSSYQIGSCMHLMHFIQPYQDPLIGNAVHYLQ